MKISRSHYFKPAQVQHTTTSAGKTRLWVQIVSVFIACVCVSTIAKATDQNYQPIEQTTAPGEVQSGTLLLPSSVPGRYIRAVSYTHLTLPTIYSV